MRKTCWNCGDTIDEGKSLSVCHACAWMLKQEDAEERSEARGDNEEEVEA
jgi:hypothetical protein